MCCFRGNVDDRLKATAWKTGSWLTSPINRRSTSSRRRGARRHDERLWHVQRSRHELFRLPLAMAQDACFRRLRQTAEKSRALVAIVDSPSMGNVLAWLRPAGHARHPSLRRQPLLEFMRWPCCASANQNWRVLSRAGRPVGAMPSAFHPCCCWAFRSSVASMNKSGI